MKFFLLSHLNSVRIRKGKTIKLVALMLHTIEMSITPTIPNNTNWEIILHRKYKKIIAKTECYLILCDVVCGTTTFIHFLFSGCFGTHSFAFSITWSIEQQFSKEFNRMPQIHKKILYYAMQTRPTAKHRHIQKLNAGKYRLSFSRKLYFMRI